MLPRDTTVEVVYIPLGNQPAFHVTEAYHQGMTVQDALDASGVFKKHPEAQHFNVGVFAEVLARDALIQPGMRLEVYQPLQGNPKEKRRQRAKAK